MKEPVESPIPTRKPLPEIANYYLREEQMDHFCNAMSDILCWMDGFRAAGGTYAPGSIESLRQLSDALKSIQSGQAKSNQSH